MHNSVVVCGKGEDINFTIYQTPLVEDHQDPRLQREYTLAASGNNRAVPPASVPLHLHEATEATIWKPTTKNDQGVDYLVAVKNGCGVAIRAHGAREGCHFRVKITAGGANVASPPPFQLSHPGTLYPNYFVMPDQQWVFGVRVGESSVRQFRVLESGTWFSWISLYGRREEESVEIQVTGFRRDRPDEYPNLPLAATKNPRGYTIFVISRSGKKFILEQMSSSDTVLNLSLRIREEEGTQVHRQRLIFNGKQLEDEWTLSDYGILKGETVHMVMQLIGGGHSIMSALPHLSVTDNTEVSLKSEQLGPGGLIHQDFATDIEPEDWYETKTWTLRFYFFDADQFKSKTGLDLDPADNVERQFQVDGFVEDRFPSFRGQQAVVSVPSIAQLIKQSRGEVHQVSKNFDCAQNEEDAGQHGDTNEEVDPEQQMGTPRKQSRSKRFLSTLMCRSKW